MREINRLFDKTDVVDALLGYSLLGVIDYGHALNPPPLFPEHGSLNFPYCILKKKFYAFYNSQRHNR